MIDLAEPTESQRFKIARELCAAAGRGNPAHAQLHHDIKNAFMTAINSPAFRTLVTEHLHSSSSEKP